MLPDVSTLALTCMLLLGTGYGVLGILTLIPSLRAITQEAWPILLTETLIVALVAGSIWIGGLILNIALLALLMRCMFEAATTADLYRPTRFEPLLLASGSALIAVATSFVPMTLLSFTAVVATIVLILISRNKSLHDAISKNFPLDIALFPGLPLILFAAAGLQGGYGTWLLIAFLLVETFDSYALLGGKLFGRTKAFPILSPRKTVEGLALGVFMLILTAAVIGHFFGLPVVISGAVALYVGALTVTGDLAASALKRRGGIKDFPPVLRLQGGLLDITDAWITAGAGLVVLSAFFGLA